MEKPNFDPLSSLRFHEMASRHDLGRGLAPSRIAVVGPPDPPKLSSKSSQKLPSEADSDESQRSRSQESPAVKSTTKVGPPGPGRIKQRPAPIPSSPSNINSGVPRLFSRDRLKPLSHESSPVPPSAKTDFTAEEMDSDDDGSASDSSAAGFAFDSDPEINNQSEKDGYATDITLDAVDDFVGCHFAAQDYEQFYLETLDLSGEWEDIIAREGPFARTPTRTPYMEECREIAGRPSSHSFVAL